MFNNSTSDSRQSEADIKQCFKLLDDGERIPIANLQHAILVLGVTGAGKTTVIKWLTGDNHKLKAVEDESGIRTIIDEENEISREDTIVSKTIFPQLYERVDRGNRLSFYDTPGYSETRGFAYDITAPYFVNKIAKKIAELKILLVVNYSSVQKAMGDRGDFVDLIRYFMLTVKNVDRYVDSVGLVVTKVVNRYKNGQLVTDDVTANSVASFLENVKNNLVKISNGDDNFVRTATKIINGMLTKNAENKYERIGIFRQPTDEGALAAMEPLQESKKRVVKMIEQSLKYASVEKNDFGYAISDKSFKELNPLVEHLVKTITERTRTIAENFVRHFQNVEIELDQFDQLRRKFDDISRRVQPLTAEGQFVPDFIRNLSEFTKDERININESDPLAIVQSGKYFQFFELVSQRHLPWSTNVWQTGLQPFTSYLQSAAKSYAFLTRVYKRLSSYEVQKKKEKLRVATNRPIDWKQFFNEEQLADGLSDVESSNVRIDILEKIVKYTINASAVTTRKLDNTYEVRGNFILLSQISINDAAKVNVFASETVFVDVDFEKSDSLKHLSIIAPTWKLIGNRQINLNGRSVESVMQLSASSGGYAGASGANGIPGKPGKPAAHFFAVGNDVISDNGNEDDKMNIRAIGGNGGPGRSGGNGADGYNGRSAREYRNGICYYVENYNNFEWDYVRGFLWRKYCLYGKSGGIGGNGGDGGAGGMPGDGGVVRTIFFQSNNSVTGQGHAGSVGVPGTGGAGGAGGKRGQSWYVKSFIAWWYGNTCEIGDCGRYDYLYDGDDGHRGNTGGNTMNHEYPERIAPIDATTILQSFREFFIEKLTTDIVDRQSKWEFLDKLDRHPSMKVYQTADTLMAELLLFENEYAANAKRIDWLSQYEKLLQSIETCSVDGSKDKNAIATLKMLEAAVRSKICLLTVQPELKLIAHLEEYVDTVNDNILIWRDKNTASLVDGYLVEDVKTMDGVFATFEKYDDEMTNEISIMKRQLKTRLETLKKPSDVNDAEILMKLSQILEEWNEFLDFAQRLATELRYAQGFDSNLKRSNATEEYLLKKSQKIYDQLFILKNTVLSSSNALPQPIRTRLDQLISTLEKNHHRFYSQRRSIERFLIDSQDNISSVGNGSTILTNMLNGIRSLEYGFIPTTPISYQSNVPLTRMRNNWDEFCEIVANLYKELYETKQNSWIVTRSKIGQTIDRVKRLQVEATKLIVLPESFESLRNKLLLKTNTLAEYYNRLEYHYNLRQLFEIVQRLGINVNDRNANIESLGAIIHSNVLLIPYKQMIKTLSRHKFPFGTERWSDYEIDLSTNKDVNNAIEHQIRKLKQWTVDDDGSTLDNIGEELHAKNGAFEAGSLGGPFYTWNNDENKRTISKLLAGQTVTLKSRPNDRSKRNMVKFDIVRIVLKSATETVQRILDEGLKNAQVILTHLGDSTYKCGLYDYTLFTNRQSIVYSVQKNENDEPVFKNTVYTKIKENDLTLSPYATWEIQLTGGDFVNLVNYADSVYVELEGRGQFLDDDEYCNVTTTATANNNLYNRNSYSFVKDDVYNLRNGIEIDVENDTTTKQRSKRYVDLNYAAGNGDDDVIAIDTSSPVTESITNDNYLIDDSGTTTSTSTTFTPNLFYNVHGTLLLADLLARNITKSNSKPTGHYIKECSVDETTARVCAINIVDKFEQILANISSKDDSTFDFDPIPLIGKLEAAIMRGDANNVDRILFETIKKQCNMDKSEFYDTLVEKMSG